MFHISYISDGSPISFCFFRLSFVVEFGSTIERGLGYFGQQIGIRVKYECVMIWQLDVVLRSVFLSESIMRHADMIGCRARFDESQKHGMTMFVREKVRTLRGPSELSLLFLVVRGAMAQGPRPQTHVRLCLFSVVAVVPFNRYRCKTLDPNVRILSYRHHTTPVQSTDNAHTIELTRPITLRAYFHHISPSHHRKQPPTQSRRTTATLIS